MQNAFLKSILVFWGLVSVAFFGHCQRLDITRVFTPRALITSEYVLPNQSDSNPFSLFKNQFNATIPIHSKFQVDAKMSRMKSLKDWKKVVKVDAHQVLWQLGAGYREVQAFGVQNKVIQASTGLMGVTYTRKLKVLFYVANVGIQESEKTLSQFSVNATGVLGIAKIKKLKHVFLYGLVGTYQFERPFIIPFIGGMIKLSKHAQLTCILPAQLKMTVKVKDNFAIDFGAYVNGLAFGLPNQKEISQKDVFNFGAIRAAAQIKKKFSNRFSVYLESGWEFWNRHSLSTQGEFFVTSFGGNHLYAKLSVFLALKESVLKSDIGNFGID